MKVFIKCLYVLACCAYLLGSSVAIAQQGKKQLYKWKDSTGKWHYSNIRPTQPNSKTDPVEINVAEDSRTIMFTKEQSADKDQKNDVESIELAKQETDCKSAQAQMRVLSRQIQINIDRSLVEQKITQDQYQQKKKAVEQLEELAIDDSYYLSCINNFVDAEKKQSLYRCVLDDYDPTTCIFSILNDMSIDSAITTQ